ncbi:MAG TPA: 50S ribosomal protein L1 [Patescibacteria group bacterium]|jgi:large subunit ribosomal protein L1|nr:50S ribosomal protein L1 [Patescibacteria group bacterium]
MSHVSKRAKSAAELVNKDNIHSAEEAIELAKKTATTKFVGAIEVHVKTAIDAKKTDQAIRGSITLPHGTGKTRKIAAFVTEANEAKAKAAGATVVGGEELIKQIKETEKTDFDIAVCEPAMMPKLAQIAKILGTRGMMPNPKTGTVSENIEAAIKEIAGGKVNFKNDNTGNVHQIIGKTDFDSAKLSENLKTFIDALQATKPAAVKRAFLTSISINSTMGPGIKFKM